MRPGEVMWVLQARLIRHDELLASVGRPAGSLTAWEGELIDDDYNDFDEIMTSEVELD